MSALFSTLLRARGFFSSSPHPTAPTGERNAEQKFWSLNRVKSKRKSDIKSEEDTQAAGWKKVKHGRITKRVNAPSPLKTTKTTGKRNWYLFDRLRFSDQSEHREGSESLEGQTLVEEEDSPLIKSEMEAVDDLTIVVQDIFLHMGDTPTESGIPFEDRTFRRDDERIQDWSDDEVWVFNKLVMRGQEPLLPYELAFEFPSWPNALFSKDQEKVFIKNINRSTTNLASAFNRFLYEGVSVRCQLQTNGRAEPQVKRALRGFHKFIVQDGRLRLKTNPPLICTTAATPNEDVAHVVERCIHKMHKAGRQWRHWLLVESSDSQASMDKQQFKARLPTVYGFVIKHSILAIMTWDSSLGDEEAVAKPVRTIGTYDWKMVGQDVWHALAVGIVECKAREYLIKLNEKRLLGPDRKESDPDL